MNAQPKMPPPLRPQAHQSLAKGPGRPTGRPGARPNGRPSGPKNARMEKVAPRNKGEDMFQIIRQLNDVLMKENVALKKHRVEDVHVLGERKTDLARLYQQQMNAFHRNPELLKEMEEGKRNTLIQAGSRLTELMKENASLLRANIQTINTFMKTVVDSVRAKQERKSTSYSKQGHLDGYAALKRNMAVSLNEVT